MRGSMGLIASVTVAALGLVGCASSHGASSGGGAAAGNGIMLAAYTHTVGQKTAKMSMTETLAVSGSSTGAESSSPAASSAADASATSTTVVGRTDIPGISTTITATGSVDFAGQAADMTMQLQGQQVEIREIGSTIYLHLSGSLAKGLPDGKTWISLDENKISQARLGASLSSLTQTSQADPAQMLSYLQAVSASGLHEAGAATIRGVVATEYDATLDLKKLAAQQKTPAAQQAVTKLTAEAGTSNYPMKVWIGQDGLVHQMQFSINEVPPTSGASAGGSPAPGPLAISVAVTIQLYDYGTALTVTAPSAAQTDDLTNQVISEASAASSATAASVSAAASSSVAASPIG